MSSLATTIPSTRSPAPTIGATGIAVASVALVVSGSTLVTELTGFSCLGVGFVISVILGLVLVVPVVFSASDLAVSHPIAGGIYQIARSVIRGRTGDSMGLFLAMLFLGTFLIGAAGETKTAAHALRGLVGSGQSVGLFAAAILAVAVIPNLFGLHRATWVTGAMLAVMLGIRWFFGAAGFCGMSATGEWDFANLIPNGGISLLGTKGALVQGIALGFWCFVGIEGASSLVSETRNPARSIPRGLIAGLVVILATTQFMGLGVSGCIPQDQFASAVNGPDGEFGQAPHLAIGGMMFGESGRALLAIASIASTLSTLLMAMAAVPRMIAALARDGHFPGAISAILCRNNPRTGSPVSATLAVAAAVFVVNTCFDGVVESLRVAAYLWFIRHLIVHSLALANRLGAKKSGERVLPRSAMILVAAVGSLATLSAFLIGFSGSHGDNLPKVGVLVLFAVTVVVASILSRSTAGATATKKTIAPREPEAASGAVIVSRLTDRWKYALKRSTIGPKQNIDIALSRPVLAHSEFGIAR